ncbi:Carboxyl-terminal-processing peptidase 2, chloroplastic [Glycine max]|nr:Carboxyl-terminal-processing peptidase 2, chloroplastic [Glycine max]
MEFVASSMSQWKCFSLRVIESRFPLAHRRKKGVGSRNRDSWKEYSIGLVPRISSISYPHCGYFPSSGGFIAKRRKRNSLLRLNDCSDNIRQHASILFVRLAWRTIDRAYIDKSFNGQSWFRYREDALRNEPMNNREETYKVIRKMLATLDDPFTRFLEPEKFRSLRSGTEGALTGVGLSIGYPTKAEMQPGGLVVISASPGGPAYRVGVLSGDVILAIDCTSTENMGLYDAAERLQWVFSPAFHLREKVSLDPVKSRLCKLPASGNDSPTVGYIKLTSFNQKASIFELSDGSGIVVTVARYETAAHTDIDKVGVIPDHPLPTPFPKDEDAFCNCLQDPASSCYVNRIKLFSK